MDELEAVEITFNELFDVDTFRLDSDYFKKKYLDIVKNIDSKKHLFKSFSELGIKVNASAFYPSLEPYYNEGDMPFLRVADVNIHIDYNNCVRIPREIFTNGGFKTLKIINNGDIIITKGGSIARIGLIEKETAVTRDLIFLNSSILTDVEYTFLYLYLMTSVSYDLLIRSSSMTAQPHLTIKLVKELPIFNPSYKIKTQIVDVYNLSKQKLEKSKVLYEDAENLLLKQLGLLDFEPTQENIVIKSFSESFLATGRLDSEYYQPKYDEIENIIRSNKYTYIYNEFEQVKKSFDKSKNVYKYIEIGNVNVSDGSNVFNYVETSKLPANAKINVCDGDLLVSKVRPYRGAVSIINIKEKDVIVSGAFTVLRKKESSNINTQVLQVLLRTKAYKELLLKYNVGTQYPVIKDDDILNLMIPLVDKSIQAKIEAKIKTSFRLKSESKQLLELAKRAVEVAIEEGEEKAILLIENS